MDALLSRSNWGRWLDVAESHNPPPAMRTHFHPARRFSLWVAQLSSAVSFLYPPNDILKSCRSGKKINKEIMGYKWKHNPVGASGSVRR